MREIDYSADELAAALLNLKAGRGLCLLDSCGVSYLDSHLLIAGIDPVETLEIAQDSAEETLAILDAKLSRTDSASMLTISYDFGLKLNGIKPRVKETSSFNEPDVFLASFDVLIVHDYNLRKSFLTGNRKKFDRTEKILAGSAKVAAPLNCSESTVSSNFSRAEYLKAVEKIRELIKKGDTYQTNLTRQIRVALPESLTTERIFSDLRKNYPAPFAAFFRRKDDVVISASPERFFSTDNGQPTTDNTAASAVSRKISVSPIKGTRPRGKNASEDEKLRSELLNSEKDLAENVMIVDLLRNDIGRICEFGSVEVKKICDLEEHPTFFHLVSTVSGRLRENLKLSDVLRAVFPCGSITGAPKIRTMRIIDELETAARGLSMGAIGIVRSAERRAQSAAAQDETCSFDFQTSMDFSVAIRTMVVRDGGAVFNVGGGITIDSSPADEYEETRVKAKALLGALNAENETF